MLHSSNFLSSRHQKTYPQFRQFSLQLRSEFLNLPFRQCITTARLITLTAALLEIPFFWMWRHVRPLVHCYRRYRRAHCLRLYGQVVHSSCTALPLRRPINSFNQHGPTSRNVWIIQNPVSMKSCCVTWTVKRESTKGQIYIIAVPCDMFQL